VNYFIVAIVLFLQPQMQSISIMQIPYTTIDQCKQAIVEEGLNLQQDVMTMYPNANRFSLVCIDKPTIDKIVKEMKSSTLGKDA